MALCTIRTQTTFFYCVDSLVYLFSARTESRGTVISGDGGFKQVVRVETPTRDATVVAAADDDDDDDATGDVICCWARNTSSRQLQLTGDRYQLPKGDDCDDIIKM